MLTPLAFISGRVRIIAGAAQASTIVVNGVGFVASGQMPVDTNAPAAGAATIAGFKFNSTGSIHGTVTTAGTDVFLAGLRVTQLGQLVYVDAAGVNACNGVFLDANSALATTAA